jgi:hypothetical protein
VTPWRSVSSPARRSGHAVLPHPANRHPSPAVFGWSPPGSIWPGCGDDAIEGDQAELVRRSVDLGGAHVFPCGCSTNVQQPH